jgi:hypothetical protein
MLCRNPVNLWCGSDRSPIPLEGERIHDPSPRFEDCELTRAAILKNP